MQSNRAAISRHRRLIVYAVIAVNLAFVGHFFFDFGREQTMAYAVTAYLLLNVLNYRNVLGRKADQPKRSLDN